LNTTKTRPIAWTIYKTSTSIFAVPTDWSQNRGRSSCR
jgi:hypothetical protein